jgi:hypothetical protein
MTVGMIHNPTYRCAVFLVIKDNEFDEAVGALESVLMDPG